ncbi:MAG: tryptophan--tRNA ligase [Candidatus Magasanikbacteria bacterium]
MKKQVIFSGIQPTGNLHIGNYLGAIKNWIELQESGKYDCYFCIVDYHALTGNLGAKERRAQILKTAAELLALGVDPDKSTFFIQSYVPEHTELAWILNTVSPFSELERMTQFKDKSKQQKKNVNVGLFTYPVLQAADILMYHGDFVPVGEDQVQHVELTRDVAKWFNKRYGDYFPETKVKLTKIPRVKSLLDPEKKMSKSLGPNHVVELADEPAVLEKKFKKAVTATKPGDMTPGVQNLMNIVYAFEDRTISKAFEFAMEEKTIQYGKLKESAARGVSAFFEEFREKRKELLVNPAKVADMLDDGALRAREVAQKTLEDVRTLVGLR